jgi:hypothetical protein
MEVTMNKISFAVLFSLSAVATAAFAQSDQGVTMSTDPAKISDIEQRAQDLQSRQSEMQSQMPMHQNSGHSGHHKKSGVKHPKNTAE